MSDTEPTKKGMFNRLFGRDHTPSETPADAAVLEEKSRPEPQAAVPEPQLEASEDTEPAPLPKQGWFDRLRHGLSKTSNQLTRGIGDVFTKRKLDATTLDELEDLLIQADLGLDTAVRIADRLSEGRYDKEISPEAVRTVLAEEVEAALRPVAKPLTIDRSKRPHIILVVGVNGTGKTTTIGKLAQQLTGEGRRVILAAGDTFRAAATEQLKIWGERTSSPVVAGKTGADAAGLVFDALARARDESREILIIDTAGRLQNKANLMAELEKIVRVIKRVDPEGPHTVLLTLDATTGQNALNQVEIFKRTAGVTGLILTKLDGTARGGILVAIADKYKLPVHAVGVGEGAEDLQPFDARDFARAIAGL